MNEARPLPGGDAWGEILAWDSSFFGVRIAALRVARLTEESAPAILHWCISEKIACLYFLAPADDPATLRIAAREGFSLTDVRVTLSRESASTGFVTPDVRPFHNSDLPHLLRIAGFSHTTTRFYFDQRFPRERCQALYEEWLVNSTRDVHKATLVVEREGKPAGYVTCEFAGPTGKIGLLAVADWARGMGLGSVLVQSALAFLRTKEKHRVSVVTQGRNIAAQRLYQRNGFLTDSLAFWYHRWFQEDP